jgi:hypothetical protein
MKKRGQQTLGMPFGLIFAMFMIVVFIVIAFIAISHFLDIGRTSTVGRFYVDLQEAVDEAQHGQRSEFSFEIDLPSEIVRICFANLSAEITGPDVDYQMIEMFEVYEANVFLIPPGEAEGFGWHKIDNINISKITEVRNPYCVDSSRDLKIKKEFYDRLVTIE